MPSASRSSVAVSVSASQLVKLTKSVTSLVLKKSLLKRRLKREIKAIKRVPSFNRFSNLVMNQKPSFLSLSHRIR